RVLVVARLAERDDIVSQPHAGDRAVFQDLLVQEPDRLRALLGDHRVFPDANLAMEDPASILICADHVAPEILHADEAMTGLARRQLHAMNRVETAGPSDAM